MGNYWLHCGVLHWAKSLEPHTGLWWMRCPNPWRLVRQEIQQQFGCFLKWRRPEFARFLAVHSCFWFGCYLLVNFAVPYSWTSECLCVYRLPVNIATSTSFLAGILCKILWKLTWTNYTKVWCDLQFWAARYWDVRLYNHCHQQLNTECCFRSTKSLLLPTNLNHRKYGQKVMILYYDFL